MRIGIVTQEFPPRTGGMAVHAQHVALELAQTDNVVVFTPPGQWLPDAPFQQKAVLGDCVRRDATELAREKVDCWLCLEATYAAASASLSQPVCVYFHGYDFVNPRPSHRWRYIERLRSCPYVWRYYTPLRAAIGRHEVRRGLPNVSRVITNSSYCARLIEEMYGRSAKVVHPGVDDSYFQEKNDGPRSQLRLLTVSRLTSSDSRKNIDGVLYALSQLVDHMDFCYTVIGEGPDRVRLIELAANLRLQNRVRFLGRVSDEELLRCYRNSDLFILASKASQYDVEGFGIVYIEASASGVPVLGSRAGGACDAIEDGVNGVLIADSSPSAIAGGIKRFVATSELFPPSQVRAFANRFRWRSMARQLRALLSESCEQ